MSLQVTSRDGIDFYSAHFFSELPPVANTGDIASICNAAGQISYYMWSGGAWTSMTRRGQPAAGTPTASTLLSGQRAWQDWTTTTPMTAEGDLIYGGLLGVATRLPGNTTITKKFLTETGTGSAANDPAWNVIVSGDLSGLSPSFLVETITGTDTSSSGTAKPFQITYTYNQTSTAGSADVFVNRVESALGSGSHMFLNCQVSSVSKASIDHVGRTLLGGATNDNNHILICRSPNNDFNHGLKVESNNEFAGWEAGYSGIFGYGGVGFSLTAAFGQWLSIGGSGLAQMVLTGTVINANYPLVVNANTVIANYTQTGSSGVQVASSVTPTFSTTGTAGWIALEVNATQSSDTGSGAKLITDFQLGGTSKANVDIGGRITSGGLIINPVDTATYGLKYIGINGGSVYAISIRPWFNPTFETFGVDQSGNAYFNGLVGIGEGAGAMLDVCIQNGGSLSLITQIIRRRVSQSSDLLQILDESSNKFVTVDVNGKTSVSAAFVEVPVALSVSGGNVNTNALLGNLFDVAASASFTLKNPTNPTNGQKIVWRITQDATGSRTITFDTAFDLAGATITLSTAANKVDYIVAVYRSAASKWDVLAPALGY